MKVIENKKNRNEFFLRNSLWLWHDNQHIDIVNCQSEVMLALNSWETLIFHEAIGERTIYDFIIYLKKKYKNKNNIPSDFEELIVNTLDKLVYEADVVKLTQNSNDLPLYFELPINELDRNTLIDAMKKDGLIKKWGQKNGVKSTVDP